MITISTNKTDHVDTTKESPVILSLCPGILGLERGIERAIGPVRVAAYVEIEAFIIENLVAAMEQGVLAPAPVWTDLKTFDAEPFRNKLHGIIGGYPCQPFSRAGNRNGADDPRHLWPYIERIIQRTGPLWCFFENVEGHLDLGYATVYKSLRDMGYRVESGIYSAEETGAPHQRNRLFIFAIREDAMAYPDSIGYNDGQSEKHPTEGREHAQCYTATSSEDELGCTMAHTSEQHVQRNEPNEPHAAKRQEQGERQAGPQSIEHWPTRPGEPQYEWEEPRTVKPEMGVSVDGYSFREDLLRALGNSVVEQTAERAFIDLLNKHINQ